MAEISLVEENVAWNEELSTVAPEVAHQRRDGEFPVSGIPARPLILFFLTSTHRFSQLPSALFSL
jgi:hypothetical protein